MSDLQVYPNGQAIAYNFESVNKYSGSKLLVKAKSYNTAKTTLLKGLLKGQDYLFISRDDSGEMQMP